MTQRNRNGKRPNIDDVAAALGLHTSTVSLALSGKGTIAPATRQKVLTTARELGYRPNPLAQRLAGTISDNLVCILSSPMDVGIATQKAVLVQKGLAARSLEVPLYTYAGPAGNQGESHVAQVRGICRQRPRAIVCSGAVSHPSVLSVLQSYQREGGALISFDMPFPLECDQVLFDREDNAYQAARCLLEQGHRKIGIGISVPGGVPSNNDSYLPLTLRLKGFERALAEFGVPVRKEWLFINDALYEEGGEKMARWFLEMPERPTGLCIVNDYVALAFMVEIMRAGVRIPEEVSIVSHDNQRVTALCPVPMTSVSHPVKKITDTVVEMLIERQAGLDTPPRTINIKGELMPRQSVAPPPNLA